MRDALSRRSGDGAPEHLPPPPGPPPTTAPADPAAPSAPPHPGDDSGGPSRPTPAPHRPQRPLASRPGDALGRPRNNPPDEEDPPEQTITTTFTPHVFKTTPEQPSGNCTLRARIVIMARVGGRGMLRVGLLGRSGAGACPNLLQRRPATGSAARRSAEYQRFSSGAPARSGPLQQIWTNGAATGPRGPPRVGRRPRRAPRSVGRARGGVRRGRHRARGDVLLGALGRRDVYFALESAVPTVILECKMHLSRAECTSRRRGGRSRSSRTAATVPLAPPRARPPAPLWRSRPVRGIFWRERPTDGETGARVGGRMHILAACGAPARDDHDQERT